jgi:hypothetical protein
MSAHDDGGPAFPRDHANDGHNGMNLLDYFAAHAPEPPPLWRGGDRGIDDMIAWRWTYAKAMLRAKARQQ